jgi:outer membrane protein assembly factor BamD
MALNVSGAVVNQAPCAHGAHRSAAGRVVAVALATLVAVGAASCGKKDAKVAVGSAEADRVLYDRGMAALDNKKWLTAREYLRQIVDNYQQSPLRADSKLGLADTYLGEGTTQAFVLAINEYREFLSFYPTHPRADYAQYKLALCHYRQMAKAQRDQTETREAITEFQVLFEKYPQSTLAPAARTRYRDARDRLSDSEYGVGYFYYRQKWYPGAIDRFQSLLKADPEYSRRDAAYFHLGESLVYMNRQAEALPWFERVVTEFSQSEYLVEAQKRVAALRATPAPQQAPSPPGP